MKKTLMPDKGDKYILIFILSCGLISILPFLTLNQYEFAYPFMWTMQFLSIPFSVVSLLLGYIFFTKIWIPKLERINKKMNRYLGIITFSAVVFLGLVFTASNGAIFCNSFVGEQHEIELNVPIVRAYNSSAGHGNRAYHHVVFKHPYQDRLVDIYVRQQYETGEILNKTMFIGSFNMFYSK
ncbi:MAG: hypothetical protein ACJASQ_001004 [Crocinitomicaceae bacterium]|jgi:hypothetical protein